MCESDACLTDYESRSTLRMLLIRGQPARWPGCKRLLSDLSGILLRSERVINIRTIPYPCTPWHRDRCDIFGVVYFCVEGETRHISQVGTNHTTGPIYSSLATQTSDESVQ